MSSEIAVVDAVRCVQAVLRRVELRVHDASVQDADRLEQSFLFRQISEPERVVLQKAAQQGAYPSASGPHSKTFVVDSAARATQAEHLSNTSLVVLVEDDTSDRCLLEEAARSLAPAWLYELWFGEIALTSPAPVVVHGVGGNGAVIPKVNRLLEEAEGREVPPRVVVLTDGDGEWPGETKPDPKRIREHCEQRRVPVHVLRKRTAENYIPDAVWTAWADLKPSRQALVEALRSLSASQRDHGHFDRPTKVFWNASKPEACALFSEVEQETATILRKGNLKGRSAARTISMLHAHRAVLSPAVWRTRDPDDELSEIIGLIAAEV